MEVNILSLIGIVATLSGILFGYVGYKKGLRTDSYEQGSDAASMRKDIEYIKEKIDRVDVGQSTVTACINGLIERVIRVEEAVKSAHKRIDRIEGGERREHPRVNIDSGGGG